MGKKIKDQELLAQYNLEFGGDNNILRLECEKVTVFDKNLKKLAQDMLRLQRLYNGTGLAAPQIGIGIRLIVTIQWKIKKGKFREIGETVLVNPIITEASEEEFVSEESCLSLPDFSGYVMRKKNITVEYQDIYGNHKKKSFSDYNAAVLQHEIDHLHGVLFIDKLTTKKK